MSNTHNATKFCWHDLCTFPANSILAEMETLPFLCRPKMVRNISHPLQLFNLSWFHWWYICRAALKYLCIAMVVHFQYFGIFHTTKHWYLMKICIKTIWEYFWGGFARQRLRRWEFPVDWGWWPSNGPPTESVTPHPWKGGSRSWPVLIWGMGMVREFQNAFTQPRKSLKKMCKRRGDYFRDNLPSHSGRCPRIAIHLNLTFSTYK